MADWANRRLGRALCACLREHDESNPPHEVVDAVRRSELLRLAQLATYHGVLNFLYLSIKDTLPVEPDLLEDMQHRYMQHVAHHMRTLADLAAFGDAVDALVVPWLVFKGPVLAELIYPRSDLRTYSDVDILVPRSAFQEVVEALENRGLTVLDRNWTYIRGARAGQVHIALPLGTTADLHWHLVNTGRVRDTFAISMADVFRQAREVTLGDLRVRTLGPVDTLVHLCLHAALSGGKRLLWLKDVEQCIAAQPPPWNEVVSRSFEWRAGPAVGIVLQRVRRTLDASIPDAVIRTLSRSLVRRAGTAMADRLAPPEAAFGGTMPSVLWSRTARDSWSASASALVGRAAGRLRRMIDRTALFSGVENTETRSTNIFVPSGGARARADYLAGVTGGFGPDDPES